MCGALSVSGVTRTGGAHILQPLGDQLSQPMSPWGVWVSHVAYRFPAASAAMSPSIHHSGSDRVPLAGHSVSGCVQVVPVREDVNSSWPGCTARVPGSVGWWM